jgi:hypothetical protein
MLLADRERRRIEDPEAFAREEQIEERADSRRISRAADRVIAQEEAAGLFGGFRGLSLKEALALPRTPPPWLFEGLQRVGHKASLIAQFKAGKTMMAANAVRSLVDHIPFLGMFEPVELAGRVVVFDYELTDDDALEMYEAMSLEHPERLHVESLRGTGFTLANDDHAETAIRYLKDHDAQYWILDPFGRAMRGFGEENSNDDVRGFFMRIDQIVKEAGLLGTLTTVHTGRAASEVGNERARGASVLDDDPDVRWILTKDGDQRFFRAEGRSGINVPEIALTFDPALNRLGTSGLNRSDSAGQKFLSPVLAYIEANPGCNQRDIKRDIPGKDTAIAAAISYLEHQGQLRIDRSGSSHQHFIADGTPFTVSLPIESAVPPKPQPQSEARGPAETHRGPASLKKRRGPRPAL